MLNATANWLSAFTVDSVQARVIAVLRVSNAGSVEGTHVFTFSSGPTPYKGAPNAPYPPCTLAKVGGLSGEINPASRAISVGQVALDFLNDATLSDLFAQGTILKNRVLTLYLVELNAV